MNARIAQQLIIEEPPRLTNGIVTPVSGRISVIPKTLSAHWNSSIPALETAAIAYALERAAIEFISAEIAIATNDITSITPKMKPHSSQITPKILSETGANTLRT